jgi:hypothetical protein
MVNGSVPNPNKPSLSIGVFGKKMIGCGHDIVSHLKRTCFDVYRHYLAMITFLDLLAHLRLVNLITTSSKLFFAVAGLANCHRLDLVSTVPLYLNLDDRLCCTLWQRTKN